MLQTFHSFLSMLLFHYLSFNFTRDRLVPTRLQFPHLIAVWSACWGIEHGSVCAVCSLSSQLSLYERQSCFIPRLFCMALKVPQLLPGLLVFSNAQYARVFCSTEYVQCSPDAFWVVSTFDCVGFPLKCLLKSDKTLKFMEKTEDCVASSNLTLFLCHDLPGGP